MPPLRSLLALLAVVPMVAADNVWTRLPPNGSVSSLAADPLTPGGVYAASADGLYRSPDQGATWNAVAPGRRCIAMLVLDPLNQGVMYGLTLDRQILKSTDAGANRSAVNSSLDADILAGNESVSLLPNAVFAAGSGYGLYQSRNGGANWKDSGFPLLAVLSLASHPDNPLGLYSGTTGGIYGSRDGGASWRASAYM